MWNCLGPALETAEGGVLDPPLGRGVAPAHDPGIAGGGTAVALAAVAIATAMSAAPNISECSNMWVTSEPYSLISSVISSV